MTKDEDRFTSFLTKAIDLMLNKEHDVAAMNFYIAFFKYAFRVGVHR